MKALFKLVPEDIKFNIKLYYSKLKCYFNKGDTHYCSCCAKSYASFVSYGILPRANAMCPNCFSLERTRLLWLYLKNEIKVESKKLKILHVSPEHIIRERLKKLENIDYVSGDIHKGRADMVLDITKISFPNNYFDVILCSHVLGFIEDEQKALTELRRVCKENHKLIIQTHFNAFSPTADKSKSDTFDQHEYNENDLLRIHGYDFIEKLEKLNFQVEVIDYAKTFSEEEQKRQSFGNGERELLIVCTKGEI